jgi:AraC family transcriptional regulator
MKMKVEIRDLPSMRVGAVHHVGPYNQISEAFLRMGEIAKSAGLFDQPGAAMVGLYYDDPETTPPEQLRSDAGIVVPDNVPLPDGLVEQRVPAGRYACTLHVGPYETLPDTWLKFMGKGLPDSGHAPRDGVSYEYYLNDPNRTPKEQLKTEIRAPVA